MPPPMARRSLRRVSVVMVGMASQASIPRTAVSLSAAAAYRQFPCIYGCSIRDGFKKTGYRSLQGVPSDDASGKFQEGFMDLGKSLVADSKTMEIMKPSMSTFDYPSKLSEAAASSVWRFARTALVPRLRNFCRCVSESYPRST